MSPPPLRRLCALAAALVSTLAFSGCAVVAVAGTAVGVAASVGGAAVSVGSAVVGTTAKVAGKVVEKSIDIAVPSSTPPVR
jgi:hypothetical protein